MIFSGCMGNPKNKEQCEKCARLPKNQIDEDDFTKWLDWEIMKHPCEEFKEIEVTE